MMGTAKFATIICTSTTLSFTLIIPFAIHFPGNRRQFGDASIGTTTRLLQQLPKSFRLRFIFVKAIFTSVEWKNRRLPFDYYAQLLSQVLSSLRKIEELGLSEVMVSV
jgi:hypothetical protein